MRADKWESWFFKPYELEPEITKSNSMAPRGVRVTGNLPGYQFYEMQRVAYYLSVSSVCVFVRLYLLRMYVCACVFIQVHEYVCK